ncbi:MAG TPA: hypothetical protein VFH30_02920 [Acidimicrobiales bacterium]|nr:hypothetical protein [Acidimicrobiales bacterium]
MSGPPSPRAALSLEASARRIGHYCWIEMRAFEILGAWTASVPEPAVKAALATHSRQHGWHAGLWHDLIPVIGEAGPVPSGPVRNAKRGNGPGGASFIAPPSAAHIAFAEALAAPDAPELTIEKLAGTYRVLVPHAVSAYGDHLDRASPVSDGPTIRALRLVLSDQLDHWHEGEALLQAQLRSDADVDRASCHQRQLETLLVAAGGIAGGPAV